MTLVPARWPPKCDGCYCGSTTSRSGATSNQVIPKWMTSFTDLIHTVYNPVVVRNCNCTWEFNVLTLGHQQSVTGAIVSCETITSFHVCNAAFVRELSTPSNWLGRAVPSQSSPPSQPLMLTSKAKTNTKTQPVQIENEPTGVLTCQVLFYPCLAQCDWNCLQHCGTVNVWHFYCGMHG